MAPTRDLPLIKLLPLLFVVSALSATRRRVSACETKKKVIQTSTIDVKKVVDEGRLVQLHTKHRVADHEKGLEQTLSAFDSSE